MCILRDTNGNTLKIIIPYMDLFTSTGYSNLSSSDKIKNNIFLKSNSLHGNLCTRMFQVETLMYQNGLKPNFLTELEQKYNDYANSRKWDSC